MLWCGRGILPLRLSRSCLVVTSFTLKRQIPIRRLLIGWEESIGVRCFRKDQASDGRGPLFSLVQVERKCNTGVREVA